MGWQKEQAHKLHQRCKKFRQWAIRPLLLNKHFSITISDMRLCPSAITIQAGHTFFTKRLVQKNRAACPGPPDKRQEALPTAQVPRTIYVI